MARPDELAYYCKICFRRRHNDGYLRRREAAGPTVRPREMQQDGNKRCATCRDIKPVGHFPRNRQQPGGFNCCCKSCWGEKQRTGRFLRIYGSTSDALDEMIRDQGGLCAVCVERPAMHVDHDHVTGVVRGVLCFRCNAGTGQFGDRADLLRRAANYVETTTWQKSRVCTGVYRLTSPRPAAARSATSSELRHLIFSRQG